MKSKYRGEKHSKKQEQHNILQTMPDQQVLSKVDPVERIKREHKPGGSNNAKNPANKIKENIYEMQANLQK